MKAHRRRRSRETHPELALKPEPKTHPGSAWQRQLTYAPRWYVRVRLGGKLVVRVAGGAQTKQGALEFLSCLKAEFGRTGHIPPGKRHQRHEPSPASPQPLLIP